VQYPELLKPQSSQPILLPSGREIQLPKATPIFRRWRGDMPADTFNHKPVLDFDGEMVFAELAILRIFQKAGWRGRWIDSYRHKYRVGYWGENVTEPLPPKQFAILDSIRAGCFGGCFDVFCWRDCAILFAESKWKGHDAFRSTQRCWLEAALLSVANLSASFLIVEWSLDRA